MTNVVPLRAHQRETPRALSRGPIIPLDGRSFAGERRIIRRTMRLRRVMAAVAIVNIVLLAVLGTAMAAVHLGDLISRGIIG